MKKLQLILKLKQLQPARLAFAILLVLVGFMILPAASQVNSQLKYIYLSGQLTSSNTGAPIADHQVYITSDSLANGFSYYATAKTDVNGFYWDTLVTNTSDGIINIYLYDFDNNQILLDRYYRFVWETDYLMFADFSIFDPNANMELQANFSPQSDPEENPLKILFKDESIGVSIKSWTWNFGDGSTSTVQDPEHTYDKSGIYMVTLTINSLPPGFQGYQSSTITKQVGAGLREFHHLGGHVFAEQFPIDIGIAYLYMFDENDNLELLDTVKIDTELGYYSFYTVPVGGRYLTKARLQSGAELYGQYMPTYFRNAFDWNYAEVIEMGDADNYECDIWLRPSSGILTGEGRITGQISYDTSLINRTPVPAYDIDIILLSSQGQFLTCRLSNIDGDFIFENIPFGTYQLFPDVAGISTSPMYVTISEDKPLEDGVNLVIFPNQITFSVNEQVSDFVDHAMLLYPNPVTDQAKISFQLKKTSALNILITDMTGRTVYSQEKQLPLGKQEIILPVRDLPAGMYQIILIPEDKVMVSGKFLKTN